MSKPEKKPNAADLKSGNTFRGEYLNQCAILEEWAINILQNKKVQSLSAKKTKLPNLFGKKLQEVRDLTKNNPELFKNKDSIIKLLEEFEPYAKLRSEFAHSVIKELQYDQNISYIFTNKGQEIAPNLPNRIFLTKKESLMLLGALKKQVKLICDQKLK